jgi:hypothetical protein
MYDSKLDALTWNLAPFFGHWNPQTPNNNDEKWPALQEFCEAALQKSVFK